MSEEVTLLPCPFCGALQEQDDEDMHYVDPEGWKNGKGDVGPQCLNCGATAESIESWNKRTDRATDDDEAQVIFSGRLLCQQPYHMLSDLQKSIISHLSEMGLVRAGGSFSTEKIVHWFGAPENYE